MKKFTINWNCYLLATIERNVGKNIECQHGVRGACEQLRFPILDCTKYLEIK